VTSSRQFAASEVMRTDVPICAYSLERAPNAKRCARCGTTHYRDAEAQRAHWDVHKRVCAAPTEAQRREMEEWKHADVETLRLKFHAYIERWYAGFMTVEWSAMIAPLMLAIFDKFDELEEIPHDVEVNFHADGRSYFCFMPDSEAADDRLDVFWSAPGMADVLMRENLLHSFAVEFREQFPNGIDGLREGARASLTPEQRQIGERLRWNEGRLEIDKEAVFRYAYCLQSILSGSAVASNCSMKSNEDGFGTYRSSCRVAAAAARRAMELWTDPLVRRTCGDAIALSSSLAFTMASYLDVCVDRGMPLPPARDEELIPGIAIDHLITASLDEVRHRTFGAKYARCVLKLLERMIRGRLTLNDESIVVFGDMKSREVFAFRSLGMRRRAKFILDVMHFIGAFNKHGEETDADWSAYKSSFRALYDETDEEDYSVYEDGLRSFLVAAVCCGGVETVQQKDDCHRLCRAVAAGVWKKEWDRPHDVPDPDGDTRAVQPLCTAGTRTEARAAFLFYLRRCRPKSSVFEGTPLPPDVCDMICEKATDVSHLLRLSPHGVLEIWHQQPWPEMYEAKDTSLEKLNSYVLSVEECERSRWQKTYERVYRSNITSRTLLSAARMDDSLVTRDLVARVLSRGRC